MDRNEKLIDVLSKRTVANGCTLEEEREAKKKIAELRGKQPHRDSSSDEQTCPRTFGDAMRTAEGFRSSTYTDEVIRRRAEEFLRKMQQREKDESRGQARCPRCGSYVWYKGSCGAGSQNILCANCFREYNHVVGFGIMGGENNRCRRPVDLERLYWYGVDPEIVRKNAPYIFSEIWDKSTLYYKVKFKVKQFTKKCCNLFGFDI